MDQIYSRILDKAKELETPFYFYDAALLINTLDACQSAAKKYNYHVHYALKANSNDELLKLVVERGYGADCVSGNEVLKAIDCGFDPKHIAFAGVGKTDKEINIGLQHEIFSFNCESIPEIENINELAQKAGKIANIALRINPNVNANTHHYITTGLEENKFGINLWEIDSLLEKLKDLSHIKLEGLHFHIGSQITDLTVFKNLCTRVNHIVDLFKQKRIQLSYLNVGGGLGINYQEPEQHKMVDFESYFKIFHDFIEAKHLPLHFELGRALVAQSGFLVSKVLYIKEGVKTKFAILDAGMTDLIRPALYQAQHKIVNVSKLNVTHNDDKPYDVVGPICESSDCFGKALYMPKTERNDIVAILSAGAYGQVMSSNYNLKEKAISVYAY